MPSLFVFGYGYSATEIGRQLLAEGWEVHGTTRSPDKAKSLQQSGIHAHVWPGTDILSYLDQTTHLLISSGPDEQGDPVLNALGDELRARKDGFDWVGYLSTTGVYGNRDGDWVTEADPLHPATRRGQLRVEAEALWRALGLPLHIFRLAGIYGPGRGPFSKVRNGTAQRIIKPGQVFSRIHVEDIAQTVIASIRQPSPGAIYNVCDNDPAPPEDVIAEAARLLGMPIPAAIPFETADLSPMARSFYAESKKVSNRRIIEELGVNLRYPDYRSGLRALLAAESKKNPKDSR